MDRHRRIDRTLFCLVASMTFGALVLHWIQPSRPYARAGERDLIARRPWYAIHIDANPADSDPARGNAHFVLDRDGRCIARTPWDKQQVIAVPGVIRIGLVAQPGSNDITSRQRDATDRLIRRLRSLCKIAQGQVAWDDTLNVPPPAPFPPAERPQPTITKPEP